ncbi:MAG TPA: M56 family metallopeptidase [Bryobacteraceae bacterium]|nr:M56 family metallopeptidase [Bryobacteraceae bacterium]
MLHLFVECAVRSTLIAAGTASILAILRVKSAAARYSAWNSVMTWMLLLPVVSVWGLKAPLRVLPPIEGTVAQSVGGTNASAIGAKAAILPDLSATAIASLSASASGLSPASNWPALLLGLYLTTAGVLLSRLAIGTFRAHRLIRTATRREGHLTSSRCLTPVTVGWLHPVVILPEIWWKWPQEQLDAVLAHERAHARRRDPLVQWFALLNRAIFCFHPLAWYLERRLSSLAEEACDAAVLAQGHDPYVYSRCLLDQAKAMVRSGARIRAIGMAMPGSLLDSRLRRILEDRPIPRLSCAQNLWVSAVCATVSVTFASAAIERQTPPPPVIHMAPPAAPTLPVSPTSLPSQTQPPKPARPTRIAQVQAPPQTQQEQPTKEQPPKDQRLIAMYFHLADMSEVYLARAVTAAQKFIGTQARPQDQFAIMADDGVSFRVLQDFTADPGLLTRSLHQLTVPASNTDDVSNANRRSPALTTALRTLGALPQKKTLLFFASGVSNASDTPEELKAMIDAAVRANVAIYPIDVRGVVPEPR